MVRAPELGNFPLLVAREDLESNQDPKRTVKDDPAPETISKKQTTKVEEVLNGEKWENVGHTF